jgi:argininosuccinate lyase
MAIEVGKPLSELTAEEIAAHSEALAAHSQELRELLSASAPLESKVSEGGTSRGRIEEQLALARAVLEEGAGASLPG